jgi:hypothetical protein
MAEIAVLLTANETALLSALARVEAKNKQLEEGFHKTRKAASPIGDHLNAQLTTITSMAAGYLSISTLLGIINSSLLKKEEIEKRSKDAAMSLAQIQEETQLNIGVISPEAQDALHKSVKQLART